MGRGKPYPYVLPVWAGLVPALPLVPALLLISCAIGYTDRVMAKLRRLQLLALCLLFPLLGTGLPYAAVWRCAHAAQLVTLALTSPTAMPCRMAGQMAMACCRAVRHETPPPRASLQAAPCKPTVTPAAPAPVAHLSSAPLLLAGADAAFAALHSDAAALLPTLPITVAAPRGPPNIPLASCLHTASHGLRAPPLA
jgi:hypothetical protein